MDHDFYLRLVDYFEPVDLIDILDGMITTEDVINGLQDIINDNREFLEEFMRHGH